MGKWHGYQDAGWNFQITAIERACLFLSLEYCLYEIPTHEFHLHFHLMKGNYPCPVKCQIEHRAEMSETHKLWLIRQSEPFGYSVFVTQDTAFSNCVILKFQFSTIIKSYFWPKDRLRQEYQISKHPVTAYNNWVEIRLAKLRLAIYLWVFFSRQYSFL